MLCVYVKLLKLIFILLVFIHPPPDLLMKHMYIKMGQNVKYN